LLFTCTGERIGGGLKRVPPHPFLVSSDETIGSKKLNEYANKRITGGRRMRGGLHLFRVPM
jgi:hypothetical protein